MKAVPTATRAPAYLVLLFATLLVTACGDDCPTGPPQGVDTGLVFTREDGSAIRFPLDARLYVWCGPWEDGLIDTLTVHVWFGTCDRRTPAAGWWLRAVRAETALGDTLWFPNSFVWDQPHGADLFVFDPPNELSTSQEGSAGYIVFHRLPCGDTDRVEFSMDAVLASEYAELRPVEVRGHCCASAEGVPPCFN